MEAPGYSFAEVVGSGNHANQVRVADTATRMMMIFENIDK
jgi:hypothetical protein